MERNTVALVEPNVPRRFPNPSSAPSGFLEKCIEMLGILKKKMKFSKYRKFFDAQIKPFLANKIGKSFMDYWLLDDKEHLFAYASFGEFDKLNAMEKILLAFAFKNDKERSYVTKQVLNYFREKNASLKKRY